MRKLNTDSTGELPYRCSLESERLRIARAIHDSVTQEIVVIICQLRLACASASTNPIKIELLAALGIAEATMTRLRRLMRTLRSSSKRGNGTV
jgi:signal transduction histidine kinase